MKNPAILQYGLAIILGILITFALAPFNIWPLALISLAGFYWLLSKSHSSFKIGWFYGLGFWGAGVLWIFNSINDYGYTPSWASIPIYSVFVATLACLHGLQARFFSFLNKRYLQLATAPIAFACLWVTFEWFRSWFLTGFPWLFIGYSAIDTALTGYAPILGIYAIGFILALSAMIPFILWQRNFIVSLTTVTIVSALWLGGFILKPIEWTEAGQERSVAMVQGNIPQDQKWQRNMRMKTMDLYQQLSEPFWQSHDLIIWPEAAIPDFTSRVDFFLDPLQVMTANSKATLITGIPHDVSNGEFYNAAISFSPDFDSYYKQRLVPFGEYLPFEELLRSISPFIPIASFSAGDDKQSPLTYKNGQAAPFICYETAYPRSINPIAAQADVLITLSNDGWFGDSHGPKQHLQMAQMRAIESQKFVLRATNTGITAIIDQAGTITKIAEFQKRQVLTGNFTQFHGATPYNKIGNMPILSFIFALLGVLLIVSSSKYIR